MLKNFRLLVLVAGVLVSSGAAQAQWVLHALGATVEAVKPAQKTLSTTTDDGSSGLFKFADASASVNFDKDVRAASESPAKLTGQAHHAILFYFGDDVVRSVYAVDDLGTGPFVKVTGAVESYDRKAHLLTLKTTAGESQKFVVGDKTVVDTPDGVASGKKLHLDKGESIRVLASSQNGAETALLIRSSGIDTTI